VLQASKQVASVKTITEILQQGTKVRIFFKKQNG
jgi:hypothetical protein